MHGDISRREKHLNMMYEKACQGCFSTVMMLYAGEKKRMEKSGFICVEISTKEGEINRMYKVGISWAEAFKDSVLNKAQKDYISGQTDELNFEELSLAERLYLITMRNKSGNT